MRVATVDYTVHSMTDWVRDTSGVVSCTDDNTQAEYLKVTLDGDLPGQQRQSGHGDHLLTPAPGAFAATTGTAAVLVTDRDGNPRAGVTVALSGREHRSRTATNSLGCAIFGYIPSGDYTATISGQRRLGQRAAGHTRPVTVNPGRTSLIQMEVDRRRRCARSSRRRPASPVRRRRPWLEQDLRRALEAAGGHQVLPERDGHRQDRVIGRHRALSRTATATACTPAAARPTTRPSGTAELLPAHGGPRATSSSTRATTSRSVERCTMPTLRRAPSPARPGSYAAGPRGDQAAPDRQPRTAGRATAHRRRTARQSSPPACTTSPSTGTPLHLRAALRPLHARGRRINRPTAAPPSQCPARRCDRRSQLTHAPSLLTAAHLATPVTAYPPGYAPAPTAPRPTSRATRSPSCSSRWRRAHRAVRGIPAARPANSTSARRSRAARTRSSAAARRWSSMTRQLRSQVCLGNATEPITFGDPNTVTFYADLERRQQERGAPQDHLRRRPPRRSPSPSTPAPAIYPDLTFPVAPAKTRRAARQGRTRR